MRIPAALMIALLTDLIKLDKFLCENIQNDNNQRLIRGLDQIHIIDENKNLILSSSNTGYMPVEDEAFKLVLNDSRPLKIINAFENKSAALIKLSKYNNYY